MDILLDIKDLRVSFFLEDRVLAAVDGARLLIREGQTVVLAGESGSGKSVTALAVTRILPQKAKIVSGSIEFCGRDILGLSKEELGRVRGRQIAYVFQEPTAFLNPVFSAGRQLIETIMLHQAKDKPAARSEALRLLEMVRIPDAARVMDAYPHELSGGLNQRVMIAIALACGPKLLIADEPTTSLDVTIEQQILGLLRDLKSRLNFSLLFITHNLAIAKRIADRVYVMHRGKVVEENDTEALFSSPRHFHTGELVEAYEKIGTLR